MKRFPLALLGFALVFMVLGVGRAAEASFNTVKVEGRNYVNLADLARYYGLSREWKKEAQEVRLEARFKKLRLKLDSRECFYNGVRIWLNDSPMESRSSLLVSEVDVRKTLDPILRPWAVPKRSIRTIMIDPGHGGEDQGTSGTRSVEKKLTLDLAGQVEKLLKQTGFQTLMTRRTDTYVSLEDRSELANSSDADLFLSLHFNSAKPNAGPRGIETYCLTPAGLSSTGSLRQRWGLGNFGEEAGNDFDPQNMLLAYDVQERLLAGIPRLEDRGVKRARFFVIKATKLPAILVEGGFLSNPTDQKNLLDAAYRGRLASAIVEGVKKFAGAMNPPKPK